MYETAIYSFKPLMFILKMSFLAETTAELAIKTMFKT